MVEIAKRFRWRDSSGNLWLPSQMETRHLFYTVRMIWNHAMPLEFRSSSYRRYSFNEFYTNEYMTVAVRALLGELLSRFDVLPLWQAEMDRWSSMLRCNGGKVQRRELVEGRTQEPTQGQVL